ncbi:RNA methyltransferase [Desulfonema ishimotonii]|uniref:RNA methyltransferase n=1 Tax=Desulfonema ishimotonii TaxID=45657 RepID=A0A401G2J7_9BACT|nr:RNA methyltransferase [Desulfonema ishimotonii]GBC63345.1 RNA methyltransferase [Desulfonema ishimotonii]
MSSESSLARRIKRHVIGKTGEFFIVTSPGLEKLCYEELTALPLSVKEATVMSGGVGFRGRLHDCYLANLSLRTASRILMRIATFRATNFKQLDQKLVDLPWELWLKPGQVLQIHTTALRSRLYHSTAISDRVREGVEIRLQPFPPEPESADSPASPQQLFVRAADDRFTLSLDSSGDLLYRRGIKTHAGRAPLRETLAAAALKMAGYTGQEPLIDPMCGSGTFSLEGAMMADRIPPGFFRKFAFTDWPAFKPRQWAHMKKEAGQQILRPEADMPPLIFASDRDEAGCQALEQTLARHGLSARVRVSCRDFFDFSPADLTDRPGVVALNPPYGIRLGSGQESRDLFQAICRHLRAEYRGWKIALIAPDKDLARQLPFRVTRHPFRHGGLDLTLLTGKIR